MLEAKASAVGSHGARGAFYRLGQWAERSGERRSSALVEFQCRPFWSRKGQWGETLRCHWGERRRHKQRFDSTPSGHGRVTISNVRCSGAMDGRWHGSVSRGKRWSLVGSTGPKGLELGPNETCWTGMNARLARDYEPELRTEEIGLKE
jgi:hypothetical protein